MDGIEKSYQLLEKLLKGYIRTGASTRSIEARTTASDRAQGEESAKNTQKSPVHSGRMQDADKNSIF